MPSYLACFLLTLSIVTDGEDRGENRGLCLRIWCLFPVVNTKHSHRRRRQGRELWTMPSYLASLTLSIVTDGEDRARGENCGLCLGIWRLFPVVKHSHRRRRQARAVDYAFVSGVCFLLLSIVTDGEDRARGQNCGLCLGIWRLFPVVKHSYRRRRQS